MQPHAQIHRRGGEHLLVGREQKRRGKIVGKTVGELRQEIGGRRRDDQKVGVARQFDVTHLGFVGQREEIVVDLVARETRDGERRHEFGGRLGHGGAHMGAAFAQTADQVEHLVGGDAAADDEKDALAGERAHGGLELGVKSRRCPLWAWRPFGLR